MDKLIFILFLIFQIPKAGAQFKDPCAQYLPNWNNIQKHYNSSVTEDNFKECGKKESAEYKLCKDNLSRSYFNIIERDLKVAYDHCKWVVKCPEFRRQIGDIKTGA